MYIYIVYNTQYLELYIHCYVNTAVCIASMFFDGVCGVCVCVCVCVVCVCVRMQELKKQSEQKT